jgi:predicted DNA-binding transcriptional regulator YafY
MIPEHYEDVLTTAAEAGWQVEFDYEGGSDPGSRRRVEPFAVFMSTAGNAVLQAVSHGESRNFRVDRMSRLNVVAS